MQPTHYCDVMIRNGEIADDLHARMLYTLHGFILSHSRPLAIAFPDSRWGTLGFLFRVFGSEDDIKAWLPSIQVLVDNGLVRAYPVSTCPRTTMTVAYLRDRTSDKYNNSTQRRLERRAVARGEAPPVLTGLTSKPNLIGRLKIQSQSSGQTFMCCIRQSTTAPTDAGGRNYGFGYTLPSF